MGGNLMDKKVKSYPNVSLGGKLSKTKGDVDSGHLRYGSKDDKKKE
jgi:hypothetical protein